MFSKLVTKLFAPAADLIDNLHTSEEERLKARTAMLEVQLRTAMEFLSYEKQLLEGQTSIVVAEAQGGSWLQRSWRPITMLTFLALVVADTMGLTSVPLGDEMWTLMQIGLGGYVVGRSAEKVSKSWPRPD